MLDQTQIYEIQRCPSCHASAKQHQRQCWVCGEPLTTSSLASISMSPPTQPLRRQPESSSSSQYRRNTTRIQNAASKPQRNTEERQHALSLAYRLALKKQHRLTIGFVGAMAVGLALGAQVLTRTVAIQSKPTVVATSIATVLPTRTIASKQATTGQAATAPTSLPAPTLIAVAPTAKNVLEPKATQSKLIVEIATKQSQVAPTQASVVYFARVGDTCENVTKKFGIAMNDFARLNDLSRENCEFEVGQRLVVSNALIIPLTQTKIEKPTAISPILETGKTYIVRKGDTCIDIARQQNVKLKELMSLNRLGEICFIKPDQILKLPLTS